MSYNTGDLTAMIRRKIAIENARRRWGYAHLFINRTLINRQNG